MFRCGHLMNEYRTVVLFLLLSIIFTAVSCSNQETVVESEEPGPGFQATSTSTQATILLPEGIEPLPSPTSIPAGPDSSTYVFDELGISLDVPAGLNVEKAPIASPDDTSKLDAYTFYIQKNAEQVSPGSDYFQMYGLLQFDLPPLSWEEFSAIQDNPDVYAYVNPIEINGLRGFETQLAGERNNFVYLFYMDGQTLRIAVSSPTTENKALAEKILKTIHLIP
jgi:hypothetical protein